MIKNKYLPLSLWILFFLFSCSIHANDSQYVKHDFKAQVKNVRLEATLLKHGKKEDMVTATVPTLLFVPPIHLDDVRINHNEKFNTEVAFIIDYLKANMNGLRKKIYSFLAPEYQKEVKDLMSDDAIFKRNTDFFKKNPGVTVFGVIKQDKSLSVLVMQDGYDFVVGINLIKINGRLYITDQSPNDLELAIVEASFFK